jgi:NADP-dependent 3-hydroxy acid dehydrogenase YdfG
MSRLQDSVVIVTGASSGIGRATARMLADADATVEEFMQDSQGGWDFELLHSEDIAAAIYYALDAPPHVDVSEVMVRPTGQRM